MFPLLRKIELFSREPDGLGLANPNWTGWGFEAQGTPAPGEVRKLAG